VRSTSTQASLFNRRSASIDSPTRDRHDPGLHGVLALQGQVR